MAKKRIGGQGVPTHPATTQPVEVLLLCDHDAGSRFVERVLQDVSRPPIRSWGRHTLASALRASSKDTKTVCLLVPSHDTSFRGRDRARWERLFHAAPTLAILGEPNSSPQYLLEMGVHDWLHADALEPEILGAMLRFALERHALRAELQLRRHMHESILDTMSDVVTVVDREGRLMSWNRRLERDTGYTSRQLSSKRIWDIVPPGLARWARPRFARAFRPGEKIGVSDLLTRSGDRIPYQWSSEPIKDHGGLVIGIVVTARALRPRKSKSRTRPPEQLPLVSNRTTKRRAGEKKD